MYIQLDQGRISNAVEAVDLSGLDDQNVARPGFEFLSVDCPKAAAFSYELDFIVWMPMRTRATPRKSPEKKYGDVNVAIIGANEVVGAALKGQLLLTDAVHVTSISKSLSVVGVEHSELCADGRPTILDCLRRACLL